MAPLPVIHPVDRISSLPGGVQAHILSFLPAQEAVRMCVLAGTWRNVWRLTRRLLITGHNHLSVQEVCGFVDRLLRLRLDKESKDYTPIDACEMVFHCGMYSSGDDDEIAEALQRWIPQVLELQVKLLRVDCTLVQESLLGHIPMLDKPLVSQHLTILCLGGLWFFETGPPSGLDFSDCPALQHLEITTCDLENVTEMTSPSVKRLVITGCYVPSVNDPLRICFPLVVSLRLGDFYDNTIALESMPKLAEAYVSIGEDPNTPDDEDVSKTECLVLQVLAEAEHLVLLSDCNTITFTRDLRFCPTYSKLKTLVLNHYWCESGDCSALACMLQHAPVLEKLTVLFYGTVKSKYNTVVELRPRATGNSTMISQHLRIIELKYSKVNAMVVKVMIFLGTLNIRFQVRVIEGSI